MNGITEISDLGREIHSLPPDFTTHLPHRFLLGMRFSLVSIDVKLIWLLRPNSGSVSPGALFLILSPQSLLTLQSSHSLTSWVLVFSSSRLIISLYVYICIRKNFLRGKTVTFVSLYFPHASHNVFHMIRLCNLWHSF